MILTDERFKKTKLICNENYERMRGMQMEVAGFLALGILVGLLGGAFRHWRQYGDCTASGVCLGL